MALNIPNVLQDARHKLHDTGSWIWLLGIQVPTTPTATRYRLCNYTADVQFDTTTSGTPLTWKRYAFEVGEWKFASDGSLVSIPVTIQNVTREVGLAIETYDGLIGSEVELHYVYSGALTNPAAKISAFGRITSCKVTNEAAAITVAARDIMRIQTPPARFSKHRCWVQFGGPLCGYVIPPSPGETVGTGFSTCSKTLASCDERGDDEVARGLARKHPEMWGGFAGLPRT